MLLQYLVEGIECKTKGCLNIEINKIEYDSKKIEKGDLFVAIKGYKEDGHEYIAEAVENGAAAVIINQDEEAKAEMLEGVTVVMTTNTRVTLAEISARYYDYPASKLRIIGVTGTKGKTTTAYMIRDIMLASGKKIGMIGTIYNTYADKKIESYRTSPESLELHKLLKDMVDSGIEYVVMEVSSHALELFRVHGIKFEIGVFTNLAREHLDFHSDMDSYLNAKAKLFDQSIFGVINADDIYTPKLIKKVKCKYVRYGLDNEANISATDIRINNNYVDFKMYINKQLQTITVPIPGKYTVYNAIAAVAVTSMLGAQMEDVLKGLAQVKVPGRSEIVDIGKSFAVLIDYAHNPSSLEAILMNTKKYVKGRVILVFGCGGNRDTTKRAKMGEIAGKYADFTVITTDNPRDEKPSSIAKDIEQGINTTNGLYKVIENRKEAIEFAMRIAWKNDTVILAGKGHETYQELAKGRKIHLDEREIVKKAAEKMPGKDEIKY